MTRIAPIVLTTLSLFLGMFFFFIGCIKLSPALNTDIHREIRRSFVRYAKVVPGFEHLGIKVPAKLYREAIGYTEVACGLALAFLPDGIKLLVNLFLFTITLGAIYTHIKIEDAVEKMYPAIAFTVMLAARLLLYYLLVRRRRQELSVREKQSEIAQLQEKVAQRSESATVPESDEREADSKSEVNSIPSGGGSKAKRRTRKAKKQSSKESSG